ncbi:CBO0543 family protein [Paucisalibacillus globulus]|uniref:CBO0543 family protein n=1 Tax=Paucisalibacillus globulus TaxID=351095 RepID=UPI0003F6F5C6|nr:CBO0543 family protein [Paucisalibacillus globulus]
MDKWEVYDEVRRLQMELVKVDIEGWYNNEFLTWQWWILLILLIGPWIVFLLLYDRNKIVSTMLVGMIVALITLTFDVLGSDMNFWGYPIELISQGPGALPFDLGIVTVTYMMMYQQLTKWKRYISGLIIMTLFFAIIGEGLSELLNLYRRIEWRTIYSIIYYLMVGIGVKWFVDRLVGIEKESKSS